MKMFRLLIVMTIICGIIYPLLVTVIGTVAFPEKANGSLIKKEGKTLGSSLIAQKFSRGDFFHSRPSAADFATVSSGASQSSPLQKSGKELRDERRAALPHGGVDAWTNSGSGLDPHISPETALAQLPRIANQRGISIEKLKDLIDSHTEGPTLGIWGQPRVNVLELNIALMNVGNNGHSGSTSRNP